MAGEASVDNVVHTTYAALQCCCRSFFTAAIHSGWDVLGAFKGGLHSGFFLPAYASRYKTHLARLTSLHQQGHLKIIIDKRAFYGMHAVPAAVEHLQSGRSFGKVVVHIGSASTRLSKL